MIRKIMKKRLRSAASLILALVLCLPLVCCSQTEYAVVSEGNTSAEGFSYTLYENGDAVITGGTIPDDGQITIPAAVDGHKVIAIGEDAFYGEAGFYSLKVRAKLNYIGASAFADCTSLTYIELQGVRKIEKLAFSGDTNLASVKGTDTLEEIGTLAFTGCASLSDLELPDTLKVIGDEAFSECQSLSAVTVPAGVTSFGKSVFAGCTALCCADTGSLKELPDSTFERCRSLVYVKFGKKLSSVGSLAFRSCELLKTLTVPASLKTVGENAFADCGSLTTVNYTGTEAAWKKISLADGNETLAALRPYCKYKEAKSSKASASDFTPLSMTVAEDSAAVSGDFSYSLLAEGGAVITEWSGSSAAVEIPGSLDGNTVKAIDSGAFAYNSSLTSVTIPDSVVYIGSSAFYECTSLSEVNGGKNVCETGVNLFYSTPWLKNREETEFVTFGDGVLIAYNGKENALFLPASVNHIGGGCFTTRTDIVALIGSDNLVSIGSEAFAWCENFRYIKCDGCRYFGDYAFSGCNTMPNIICPEGLLDIGQNAFGDCYSLRYICLGESLKELKGGAFFTCQAIRLCCIPESVTLVSASTFDNCMVFIFRYPGTLEKFRSISQEDSVTNYLSDCPIITG